MNSNPTTTTTATTSGTIEISKTASCGGLISVRDLSADAVQIGASNPGITSTALPTSPITVASQLTCTTALTTARAGSVANQHGKIFGRNANGTMVATFSPTNEAEVTLYRVLQHASLLVYYDTLLEMGGDDVKQLYDAGEEEFLEIMALVGMASKPLHVRRLQKALHEWATNPSFFRIPTAAISEGSSVMCMSPEPSTSRPKLPAPLAFNLTPLISAVASSKSSPSPSCMFTPLTGSSIASQVTSSSPIPTPLLTELQMNKLAQLAEQIIPHVPQKECRQPSTKKRSNKEMEKVIAMQECDPRRMDEIRKFSAIYGRFDCKRRPEKPLTLHELCVNEAAAQICKLRPTLLTRRDELFPLARQIVKDAGFGHSILVAKHLEEQQKNSDDRDGYTSPKRGRLQSTETIDSESNKETLEESGLTVSALCRKLRSNAYAHCHSSNSNLDTVNLTRSEYESENDDSRPSFGTCSSPSSQLETEYDFSDQERFGMFAAVDYQRTRIKSHNDASFAAPRVVSASGSQIIAVANPELLCSSPKERRIIKKEAKHTDK